jgi:TetR/AcrR family transcriptional regulator, tetracycline repressor protein
MSRPAPSENREQRRAEIVRAALELLDEGGLEALSMRRLAQTLGMHAPGLYWYIEDKQELINLMARAILDEALTDDRGPDGEGWEPWLTEVAVRMRRAMLARRDGARVVAGSYLFRTRAITGMLETAVRAMEDGAGYGRDMSLHGAITVLRYTMGIALDDQAEPRGRAEELRKRLESGQAILPEVDAERYPRVAEVMGRWVAQVFVPGTTPQQIGDRHFRNGLALVMAGIRSVARDKAEAKERGSSEPKAE